MGMRGGKDGRLLIVGLYRLSVSFEVEDACMDWMASAACVTGLCFAEVNPESFSHIEGDRSNYI